MAFNRRLSLPVLILTASLVAVTVLPAGTGIATGIGSAKSDPTQPSWGTPQTLTSDSRIDDEPTVVITPAGQSVVMWIERHGLANRLVVSRLATGSDTWTPAQSLSNRAFNAAIATHGHNQVTIAWQQHEPHGASIQSRTLRSNGTWGPTEQIAQWQESGGILVSLVLAGNAHGDLVAVWTRGNYIRTAYRSLPDDWQSAETIPVRGAYALTAVANVTDSGAVELIFTRSVGDTKSDLYAYHRTPDGTWSGEALARIGNESRTRGPVFAAAGNDRGDVSVTWVARTHPGAAPSVFASYQPKGKHFSPAELVAHRAQSPDLDLDSAGTTTLVWATIERGPSHVKLARRTPYGNWSATQTLAETDPVTRIWPELVVDGNSIGDSVVHVVGQLIGGQNGTSPSHLAFDCPAGSDCGEGFPLSPPPYFRVLTIATAPSGGATAVWTQGCVTEECIPTSVHARQMTPVSAP